MTFISTAFLFLHVLKYYNRMEFDLQVPSCSLFVGNTATGKTHAFRWIFSQIAEKFDYGVVISSTCLVNDDYDYIPKKYRHSEFDPDLIEALEEKQSRAKAKELARSDYRCPMAFIILDDIIGSIDFRDKAGRVFNGVAKWRHLNISTFFIVQHLNYLSNVIRMSAKYVFVTRVNDSNVDALYEVSAVGFESRKRFKDYLNKNCINYNLLCFRSDTGYSDDAATILHPPAEPVRFRLKY